MAEDAFLDLATHKMHYRIDDAAAPAGAPWLVFCNSLGTDLHMWDAQVAYLAPHFRLLRYDRRGHGGSSAPQPPYTIDDLGGDVLALMDAVKIERAHFCGLSIGGLTGQWLGVNAPGRFTRMVFCATAAKLGTREGWDARIASVRADGLAALKEGTIERWFSPAFAAAHGDVVAGLMDTFVKVDPNGYNGCCAALGAADLRAEIGAIAVPVLAISGDADPVCPPADLQFVADTVQSGRHLSLPGRHIINIEAAPAFNAAVLDFLKG